MKVELRRTILLSLLLNTGAALIFSIAFAATCWGQSPGIERAKAAMEESWRLEEWHVDGERLLPPQADGRLSVHDGVIMVLMHRELHDERKSFYGYGTYTWSPDTWSYGYDRYIVFTDTGSAITAGKGP